MAVTTSNIAIETTVTTGISGISLGEDDYYFKYLDNEYRILDTPVNKGCVNLSTLANVSVYTKNDDNTFDANIFSLNDISVNPKEKTKEDNSEGKPKGKKKQ